MKRAKHIITVAILPLVLAGCSTVGGTFGKKQNIGPCPAALVLWDAARKVEIDGDEKYENVGYTAEILGVRSLCEYYDDNPLDAELDIDMAFGRGPNAEGDTKEYRYFVAITRKGMAVIDKQFFSTTVKFEPGQQIIQQTERFDKIIIPRVEKNTSGTNFEIIVGLELTPDELEFARSGKRFRIN